MNAVLDQEPTVLVEPLVQADRCDVGENAQALVRVLLPSGNALDWCGHHYEQHEYALATSGAVVMFDLRQSDRKATLFTEGSADVETIADVTGNL